MSQEFDYRASCLKRIDFPEEVEVEYSGHRPQVGDVIAVRITDVNDTYRELDLEGGELVELEEGDVVLGTFGNRSGVKGYIGEVPEKIEEGDKLSFLGSGGIFGDFRSATKELDDPCEAEFLGYVRNGEEIMNMKDYGIERAEEVDEDAKIVAVVASRMDAGKTTLASKMIKRLSQNYDVGALKLTGSARERDRLEMYDSGAEVSLDFVDAGIPSTVEDSDEVIQSAKGLIEHAWSHHDLDFIVVEFGAGFISNYRVQEVMRDLDVKKSIFSVCTVSLDVIGAYGLKKGLGEIDYEIDFVSGPITDTTAGKSSIEDYVGTPAYNAFHEDEIEEAVQLVARKYEDLD
jgi:molybdopterin-guanine dinucleotide biosynthesis protein